MTEHPSREELYAAFVELNPDVAQLNQASQEFVKYNVSCSNGCFFRYREKWNQMVKSHIVEECYTIYNNALISSQVLDLVYARILTIVDTIRYHNRVPANILRDLERIVTQCKNRPEKIEYQFLGNYSNRDEPMVEVKQEQLNNIVTSMHKGVYRKDKLSDVQYMSIVDILSV